MTHWLSVVVQTPVHSALAGPLTYRSEAPLAAGSLVRVPLGARETLGVVWGVPTAAEVATLDPESTNKIRAISGVLEGLVPLSAAWCQLVGFAARYYQRGLGEVALAALPPQLRDLSTAQLTRRLKRPTALPPEPAPENPDAINLIAINDQQARTLSQINAQTGPFLLFGATGSGKTEVYLRAVQRLLDADPAAQALVMVPEINLTPQLEERFTARFAPRYGAGAVVSLHSGLTHPQRLKSWLAAHSGGARIVLGTRMAVFASMPRLGLIVVDEEHDPSYKQQEGARYSARDLAVYRGRLEGAKVVLGSATPSLESWHQSRPGGEGGGATAGKGAGEAGGAPGATLTDRAPGATPPDRSAGKYIRLSMPGRIGGGALPAVRLVDMNLQPKGAVFSPPLLAAIEQRIRRGEQAMVFLNRRGYAPVLACGACDWKSECPHCSAYRVFHKIDRTLRCHHCGYTERVPRACPACGNLDIAPLGRGTERLEEQLAELLAEAKRPDGSPVRIARIDADTTRLKGTLETQLAQVHAGEVDVLVGTQMIAKGHDFRRITLVAAVNPDSALFSADFRAPERLFSLLMQAGGRAGRDAELAAQTGMTSEMWVQSWHPQHPLFAALKRHDFDAFAASQLRERQQAGLPPFAFQALVRAEARTQEAAQAFLAAASAAAAAIIAGQPGYGQVTLYSPVPMSIQRVANVERAQMLVESAHRAALQRFLADWQEALHAAKRAPEAKGLIRWAVDVDPLAI